MHLKRLLPLSLIIHVTKCYALVRKQGKMHKRRTVINKVLSDIIPFPYHDLTKRGVQLHTVSNDTSMQSHTAPYYITTSYRTEFLTCLLLSLLQSACSIPLSLPCREYYYYYYALNASTAKCCHVRNKCAILCVHSDSILPLSLVVLQKAIIIFLSPYAVVNSCNVISSSPLTKKRSFLKYKLTL